MNEKERIFTCDAYDAGFDVEPSSINGEETLTDLKLTRFSEDYSDIDKYTLFAVNGLVYPSIVLDDGIYLKNGYDRFGQRVNLIRTNLINHIEKEILSPDDIINPNDLNPNDTEGVYIRTNFNLLNGSFILILAGHLFVSDDRISVIDENTFTIKQISLGLDKKFIEASESFNNDSIAELFLDDFTLNRKGFYDFETFRSILSNGSSFIAYFDRIVECRKTLIGSHHLPGRYILQEPIDDLFITRDGKVLDYQVRKGNYQTVIESSKEIDSLARSFTTDNIDVTNVANDEPFNTYYKDILRVELSTKKNNS